MTDSFATRRVEVVFVSPGGVVTRTMGREMVRVRGEAFLLGTGHEDDLLAEVGAGPGGRVPGESRSARRSAVERIAAGAVCGSSELDGGDRRRLLEHVASTPFLATDDDDED